MPSPLDPDQPLRRTLRAVRRRLSSSQAVWEHALPEEVRFWAEYIRTRGLEYPDEFVQRMDPDGPVSDPLLLEAIAGLDIPAERPLAILDAGSGPLTSVGFIVAGEPRRRVQVTPTDPLADDYNRLLDEAGLTAPARVIACRGEDIAERFGPASFDIAYARNSLDHAVDPLAAITGMAAVVAPAGRVVLIHNRREAEAQHYEQLHQWNFDVQDDALVLYNRSTRIDVGAALNAGARVDARTYGDAQAGYVGAIIRFDGV